MKNNTISLFLLFFICLLQACGTGSGASDLVRERFTVAEEGSPISPDYTSVTIPPNIAPLNFRYSDPDAWKAETIFQYSGKQLKIRGLKVKWSERKWKRMLHESVGGEISVKGTVAYRNAPAKSYGWKIYVSPDPVDAYLSYRLIEPGYEVWDDVCIVERCTENFKETVLSSYENTSNACMNCHVHCQGRGDLSIFYLRGPNGGAILNRDGKLRKLSLKDSTMISGTVYGEIHPEGRFGVFSSNIIIPGFHTFGNRRLEVFDSASDLCIADFDSNRMIVPGHLARKDVLETFPAFSAGGDRIFYCSADTVSLPGDILDLKYSLNSVSFNAETGECGTDVEVLREGVSVCHPKASPDGRFLVYTIAGYGTFPIWHTECDLEMMELGTGRIISMEPANSDRSDSYHSWSSNSRWLVFASKRGDGQYGKPFFCHIGEDGSVSKPFVLPQKDPSFYEKTLKSFNIPDLSSSSVGFGYKTIGRIWKDVPTEPFGAN